MAEENTNEATKSEEELLNEWQDMAADDGGADAGGEAGVGERILDQSEIDSLLGVSSDDGDSTGLASLINSNVVNYEKLPMLDHIFDKFERFLSTSLRHFTADNVDITIESIASVRFGDYLNSVPLPAGMVVVNASGLDDYLLLVYESKLIYSVVDILLGGRKARPARIEGRNFTTIERTMLDNLTTIVLRDLGESFAPVAPIKFKAERMEVNPRFATITREGNAAILVTVRINLEEREGVMEFCIPYATIEPIREQLLQQFMGEKFGQDNIWENHLAQELYHTNVDLAAVLDTFNLPLRTVMNWKIGDMVETNAKKTSAIQVKCGHVTKLVGTMGKVGDLKAIKIFQNVSDVNNAQED